MLACPSSRFLTRTALVGHGAGNWVGSRIFDVFGFTELASRKDRPIGLSIMLLLRRSPPLVDSINASIGCILTTIQRGGNAEPEPGAGEAGDPDLLWRGPSRD